MKVVVNGIQVTLDKRNFVAQGGQGSIYVQSDRAFKIYHKPQDVIPSEKVQHLQAIKHPSVIKPEGEILSTKGERIGYAMRFVKDTYTLCQLFPRAFKERHNHLTPEVVLSLVLQLREALVSIHHCKVQVIDFNELNTLVAQNFQTPFIIDVDSFQTPGFPATVIMPSVRDWQTPISKYGEGSDWFSFAVVTFQLFIGIHPYKGGHPTVKSLEDRMKANISVFDKEVSLPRACYTLDTIPPAYRDWYKSVFVNKQRYQPPEDVNAIAVSVPIIRIHRSSKLDIKNEGSVPASLRGRWKRDFLEENLRIDISEIASHLETMYLRSRDKILEVVELPGQKLGTKIITTVMEHASRLYPGVAIQNMLGATYVSVFPRLGTCYQAHIQELDGVKISDAKFENGVLMVVGALKGKYDRYIFRFDESYLHYDHRTVKDITPSGINFTVTDSGICVCLTEEEKLEAFSIKMASKSVKVIEDPTLGGDMELVKFQGGVGFIRGGMLYSMKLR
jgi:serine/threonine protein kinase